MWARAAAVGLILAGLWARCANFRTVLPEPGRVELLPSDSHYYARFARMQLRAFPRYQAFDPYVNHPDGARIILPPLHALSVAALVGALGEERTELAAALTGPVLSLLELCALAVLAVRVLGRGPGLAALALFALLPVTVDAGALGNADHHLHEAFLAAAVALAFTALSREPTRRRAVLAGLLLGLGRFLAPAAFMFIPCAAVAGALTVRSAAALATTGAAAALLLLAGALLFGQPGSLEYEALSAFHPLLAVACFSAAAAWAGRRSGDPRWRWLGAVSVGAAVPLVVQVGRALGHLGRADPMLALVTESEPLIRDPRWALQLLGVALPALPAAVYLAIRSAIRERTSAALPALALVLPLAMATAAQARFSPALAGAASVLLPIAARALRPRVAMALGALAGFGLLFSLVPRPKEEMPADIRLVRPTLLWMRDHLPPASSDPYRPDHRPSYGVIATFLVGHTLPFWAERPAVATLFSQAKVHVAGNRRAADVLGAGDEEEAFRLAVATGARYVLATPSERILWHEGADLSRTLLGRLLEHPEASGHFRLIHDSAEQRLRPEGGSYARLFEVVPGARLEGRGPPPPAVRGPPVAGRAAAPPVRISGADGYSLRVATPGRYEIGCAVVEVDEAAVQEGRSLQIPECQP
jgi:dolichyl-diphosphooligosaccharide--protein glycosyltransferase